MVEFAYGIFALLLCVAFMYAGGHYAAGLVKPFINYVIDSVSLQSMLLMLNRNTKAFCAGSLHEHLILSSGGLFTATCAAQVMINMLVWPQRIVVRRVACSGGVILRP